MAGTEKVQDEPRIYLFVLKIRKCSKNDGNITKGPRSSRFYSDMKEIVSLHSQ